MTTRPHTLFSLLLTALCAGVFTACQEMEDGGCHISGREMPKDWVLTEPRKSIAFTQPDGTRCQTVIYDLSKTAPFAAYCGKEVLFSPACAIKRTDYAGGIAYDLTDHTPLPGGVIDLYSMPVQKGKLLAVRSLMMEEAPEGSDSFTTTRCKVEALLEVQHPDTTVNQGRPLYLVYNLGHEGTKATTAPEVYTDIKRAPWEPADTPATRSISAILKQQPAPADEQ